VPNNLAAFLQSIEPPNTYDKIARSIDQLVNTFRYSKSAIDDRDEFEQCLAGFYCHLENGHFKKNRAVNRVFDYDRCSRMILEEYGSNGEKVAFEMARTGVDGGIYSIYKLIARKLIDQFAQNQIRALVSEYLNGMDAERWMKISNQYQEKYGHLLPPDFKEGSVAFLCANLNSVLEEHPRTVQRMRTIGR
jgi:hypothetical protein